MFSAGTEEGGLTQEEGLVGERKEDMTMSRGGGPKGEEKENQEAHQLPPRREPISKPVPHSDPPSLPTQQEPTLSPVCQPPGLCSAFISSTKLLNSGQSSQCKDAGICEQGRGLCLHCIAQAFGNLRPEVSPGQGTWERARYMGKGTELPALSRGSILLAPPCVHQLILLFDGITIE